MHTLGSSSLNYYKEDDLLLPSNLDRQEGQAEDGGHYTVGYVPVPEVVDGTPEQRAILSKAG